MIFNSNIMNLNIKNLVCYLTFKKLEKIKFLNHAFTTKIGATNYNFDLGTKNINFEKNLTIFCNSTDFLKENLCFTNQIHSSNIKVIKNLNEIKNKVDCDALITNIKNITLTTSHADCCPIFVVDPIQKVIGLAHAGWRGTRLNIAGKMINLIKKEFNSNPQNLICALGPCINKCCFETDIDVAKDIINSLNLNFKQMIDERKIIFKKNEKYLIDILEINAMNLRKEGITPQNIVFSDLCTKCSHELLFSRRVESGTALAMMNFT